MKALFHWARKNDVLANIPNIDAVSRGKIVHQEKFTFDPEQINKLLSAADVKMRAMTWLGLNCGFGCTDCSVLKWSDLDLVNGRVKLARKKTGIPRDLPLWPETVESLKNVPKIGKLVFYTSRGNPYIQTLLKTDGDGNEKYTTLNAITTKFSRLIKKSGFDVPMTLPHLLYHYELEYPALINPASTGIPVENFTLSCLINSSGVR